MKNWWHKNWLSLAVGLILPAILSGLWSLFHQPLEALSSRTLSSLALACVILCCVVVAFLIHFARQAIQTKRYVNKQFYPNETTHGAFQSLTEEMEHDREFSKGWHDAIQK